MRGRVDIKRYKEGCVDTRRGERVDTVVWILDTNVG